jgi:hypothetical protein
MMNCQNFPNLRENLIPVPTSVRYRAPSGFFTRNSKSHAPAAPTRIFCPIIFITSSPITQPTPPRIKTPITTPPQRQHSIIIVASRLFLRQTPKQLSTLQKRTFTTSTVRMVNLVTSVADFKSSIKSGVSVVDFYATWCGPCKVKFPSPTFAPNDTFVSAFGGTRVGLMDCANLCVR